jgi:hypothetical protein
MRWTLTRPVDKQTALVAAILGSILGIDGNIGVVPSLDSSRLRASPHLFPAGNSFDRSRLGRRDRLPTRAGTDGSVAISDSGPGGFDGGLL